jgi:ribose transport system permease protein
MKSLTSDQATASDPFDAPASKPGKSSLAGFSRGLRAVTRAEFSSVLFATIGLVLLMGTMHPEFLTVGQIVDILQQSVYPALLAIGLCFLIAMREVDLSVGSMLGITLVTSALLMRQGTAPWAAVVVALVLGAALGAFNATVVRLVGIQSLMATLATASLFRGVAIGVTSGEQVVDLPLNSTFFNVLGGDLLGLPTSIYILLLVVAGATVLVRLTPFGYRVRNIGSNPEAAEFSGISVNRVRTQALVLSGVLAALAGLLALAYFTSGDPTSGTGMELNAVAAAIIGGTPLRGGTCSPLGAALGAILLTAVSSGLVYFNVPVNWSQAVTGAVILVALALDSALRARRARRLPTF